MSAKQRFGKLLEPGNIGLVKTKNRMVKTASGTGYDDQDHYITEKLKAYYEALARGSVGLIIVENCAVDYPLGHIGIGRGLRLDDDKYIAGYSELTRAIHKHGGVAFLQLQHAGPWHMSQVTRLQAVSASTLTESELPGPMFNVPRELTIAEIEVIVDKFARAVERAQKAGFDGVEINGNSTNLINSFLSRAWNKRQDTYGCGDLKSRARFAVEIVRETKRRVGQGFPMIFLISGIEYGIDKGTTIKEAQCFARMLQDAGVDAIHTRAGHGYGELHPSNNINEQLFYPEPPKLLPEGFDWSRKGAGAMVPLAAAIKKVVSIPVITVGGLDPILGEKILREGKADFIGMTRRLLADPELPNKVAAGRLEDIVPCTACKHCESDPTQPVRCRVNAALGMEPEYYVIKQAAKSKRVVVVGGGPAGMETARVAAMRGHDVLLFERGHKLAGLLPLAAMIKGLEVEDLEALARYLKTQITKLGVKIRLGTEVNLSLIEEINPDTVIIATGGIPVVPEIPGIDRRNVVDLRQRFSRFKIFLRFLRPKALRWLTKFWLPLGKKVVIIGGGIHGCQLAEFLIKRGRKVTIVDTADTLGEGLIEPKKLRLFGWLAENGVTMMSGVKYEEITDKGLVVITKEGQRQTIEADNITTTMPLAPNTELLKGLQGKVPEVYLVGDCREPRLIIDAIADGYRVARTI